MAHLRREVRQFVRDRDWEQFHYPKDLAVGLAIEAAEVLEHFRFRDNDEIRKRLADPTHRRELGHELADVLYFVLLTCDYLELDVSSLLREKLAVSAQRYPVEKARGNNRKYTELTSGESP